MSRKVTIAIIGDFPIGKIYDKFPDRKSGYPTWLYNLYLGFKEIENFDIHWIIADKQIKQAETYHHNNQTFHLIPATRLTIGLYTAYAYNRFRIAQCLKRINPDIVHGWGTERFYSLAANDFKGKTLISVQGLLIACGQRAKISPFERKHSLYEKHTLRSANYITTESGWAADRVRELAPNANILHWEYAVEAEFFSIKRNLDTEPSCILVGTDTPVKNVDFAIKVFSKKKLSHIKLYLAGVEKSKHPDLPPNIIPLGKLNRADLISYMSRAWGLVHVSLADTGPTVVKEARVAGLPVILTYDCGSKQHVADGQSGFIISPGDEESLENAVLKITESRQTNIQMGEFEKEKCQHALSTETMIARIIEIYNSIISVN